MYMFVGSQNSYNTWYKANFQVKFRKDNIHHCAVSARSTDLHANLSLPLPRQISMRTTKCIVLINNFLILIN